MDTVEEIKQRLWRLGRHRGGTLQLKRAGAELESGSRLALKTPRLYSESGY